MSTKRLQLMVSGALFLAFFVVMLGAYTRLTDAGLGCPDWPGCYGRMVVTFSQAVLNPMDSIKAWTEMIHRYAAGTLGLLILGLSWGVSRLPRTHRVSRLLPVFLLLLVLFQAALGMWTVTLKLLPVVVMGHLLGGLLIFSSLCFLWWQLSPMQGVNLPKFRPWIRLGLVIVFCQIALGGWVSSNYAGIACIGFPQCNGQWFPIHDVSAAFNPLSAIGANYQGGLLEHETRVTIQVVHRLGAYITGLYGLFLSISLICFVTVNRVRVVAFMTLMVLGFQFALGVVNVVYLLPLWSAVAHNGGAALLLGSLVSLNYLSTKRTAHE